MVKMSATSVGLYHTVDDDDDDDDDGSHNLGHHLVHFFTVKS